MLMTDNNIKIEERGWPGHFCCSCNCRFRRNTLISKDDKHWVVSTVGNYVALNPLTKKVEIQTIGLDRWYETKAFEALDDIYKDADVECEIDFISEWGLFAKDVDEFLKKYPYPDLAANEMHDNVVKELILKIGETT